MIGIQKLPFTITVNKFKQESPMDGKPMVNAYLETGYSYSLEVLSHKWHYSSEEKSSRHYLNRQD